MKLKFHFLTVCIFLFGVLQAQHDHQSVFAGEEGTDLIEKLVQNYKPIQVLDFAEAKDVMYKYIYEEQDSVACIYTGHKLYLDPTEDPSIFLYKNGSSEGINAEHNVPKSKGAKVGNALSDLFNLFPSRVLVNSDRANLPFGEIPDSQTSFWYWLAYKNSSIPSQNIDLYSEWTSEKFEPREDHKGNVARSVFYFYTMYQNEMLNADPAFFEIMNDVLCDWHYYDPVDSLEWQRNYKIASYQSDKLNPFVLDCSLAGRSYCNFIDDNCTALNSESFPAFQNDCFVFPNPFSNKLKIKLPENFPTNFEVNICDLFGRKIYIKEVDRSRVKTMHIELYLATLEVNKGMYTLFLNNPEGQTLYSSIVVKNW